MRKLVKNAIRCKLCGDIIESTYTHDFKWCSCQSCYVDGGKEYRRIGGDISNWEDLSEYADVPGYIVKYVYQYGGLYSLATTDSVKKIINRYEGILGCKIEILDEDGKLVYKTEGYDEGICN